MVNRAVEGFGVTQIGEPEIQGGTLEVQLDVWPKDELKSLAQGVCREIASYIKAEGNAANYPDLVQIYGNNGDYWLQCQPRDIPAGQEHKLLPPECEAAIAAFSTMSDDAMSSQIAAGQDPVGDACAKG